MTRANPSSRAPELKFTALDLGQAQNDGAFEGYASLFDREDLAHDVISPSAFRQSLIERFVFGTRVFDIRSVIDVEEAHRFQRCMVEERLP